MIKFSITFALFVPLDDFDAVVEQRNYIYEINRYVSPSENEYCSRHKNIRKRLIASRAESCNQDSRSRTVDEPDRTFGAEN
jgi:hypothetical protein